MKFLWIALIVLIAFIIFSPKNNYPKADEARLAKQENGAPHNVTDDMEALEHAEKTMSMILKDPDKMRFLECIGINPWETKPDGWTAPTAEECAALKAKFGNASGVNVANKRLCTGVSYNNPNYHKNMEELAKKAHLPDNYYTRYHEDLVNALCQDDLETVSSLIDKGDVTEDEVTRLKQALMGGTAPITKGPAQKRSDAGRSWEYSKRKFLDMGLCMACADNVAEWYVERPTSRCGMLAKHALEGDPEAVKELQTFPSYCKPWDVQ